MTQNTYVPKILSRPYSFPKTWDFTYDSKDKDEENKLQLHYFHPTRFSAVFTMQPVTKNY